MKHFITLLTYLVIGVAMIGSASAADRARNNIETGTVDRIETETRTIIIDDWVYQYPSSVVIHTSHTNFGTIDMVKPGVSVRFRAQQGDIPVIEEIWVGEQRKRFRSR